MDDMKITTYSAGAASLPDNPSDSGMTPDQIKAALDSRSNREIKEKHNALVDAVANQAQALYTAKSDMGKHTILPNPHGIGKDTIGLGNVDNTSDAAKPVSAPQKKYIAEQLAKIPSSSNGDGSGLPSSIQVVEFTATDADVELFSAAYNALPSSGGTIILRGKGTFNLTDTRLRPEMSKPVVIIAYGAEVTGTYTVTDPTAMEMPTGLLYAWSDLTVLGGKWSVDASFDAAFYCFGGNYIIRDCDVKAIGSVLGGIYFMAAASFRVEGCTVASTVGAAISDDMPSSTDGVICGCDLGGVGGALKVYGCSDLTVRDNVIRADVNFHGAMEIYRLMYINNFHLGATVSLNTASGISLSFINGNYGADFSGLAGVEGVTVGENYTA